MERNALRPASLGASEMKAGDLGEARIHLRDALGCSTNLADGRRHRTCS